MSPRERWIVYPLLFFSFGLAIRDQVPEWKPRPDFNVVTCKHLIVQDEFGGPAVDIHAQRRGANAGSGVITVYADSPKVGNAKSAAVRMYVTQKRSGVAERYGAVETFGPLGSPAIQLISDQSGGAVHTFDPNGKQKHLVLRLRPNSTGTGDAETPAGEGTDPDEEDPRKAKPRPPTPDEGSPSSDAPESETARRTEANISIR